jgi:hypothetical protein
LVDDAIQVRGAGAGKRHGNLRTLGNGCSAHPRAEL